MAFRMFSTQTSPIAIDFGATSVKLLQTTAGSGSEKEKPAVIAAAEVPIPDAVRENPIEQAAYLEQHLPETFKSGGFKGRRAAFALPTAQTIIQHLQLALTDGLKREDAVRSQLQINMGISPDSVVVRSHEVAELNRDGQARTEVICFAIPRELIMRHVSLLEKCRLEVSGVHGQPHAVVRAFDHIHRRAGDENLTTMYIDLGWSVTCVAVAHGSQMTFARAIQIGGKNFDQLIAKSLKCDLAQAREHRLSLTNVAGVAPARPAAPAQDQGSDGDGGLARLTAAMAREPENGAEAAPASAPTMTAEDRRKGIAAPAIAHAVEPDDGSSPASKVDFSEVLETIADELSMCLRYHRGVFPNRSIDRVVLLGGEARQEWLCRHVARALRLPARLGDPMARFSGGGDGPGALDRSKPQPGWATACGLLAAAGD